MPTICWTKSFPDSPKQLRNLPLTVNKCRKNWFRNLLLLILNPSFFISPLRYFPFIADRMMTEMIILSRLQLEFSGFPLAELSGKFISIKMNPPLFQNKLDSFEKKETILWRNNFSWHLFYWELAWTVGLWELLWFLRKPGHNLEFVPFGTILIL